MKVNLKNLYSLNAKNTKKILQKYILQYSDYLDIVVAIRTGLEPATSAVTGRHSNQLNYRINFLKRN